MKPASTAKKWIGQIARPYVGRIVLLSLISGVSAGSTVVFALLSQQVIDSAIGGENFWWPGLLLVSVLAVRVLLSVWYVYLNNWISGKMEMSIKERVFTALFRKQWQDVNGYHSGELLHRMTGDSNVVVTGLVGTIPHVVSMAVSLIACLTVLFTVDWKFTAVLLAVGLLMLLLSGFYGKKMKTMHKQVQTADGAGKSFVQEVLANWMMVQSFEGFRTVRRRMDDLLTDHFKKKMRRTAWSNIAHGAMYLLFNGSYYVALLWGAFQLASGALTYGALTALLQIVSQIRAPFMNMSGILPQYYNMMASAERILELENLPDEPRLPQLYGAEELYGRLHTIEVSDVSFAYDEEKIVLSDADFTLRKGEFVALAGFSGIGKTTLFKLLLGFYPPDSGTLTAHLDEEEKLPLGADTRCLFAYVPQQSMLLSGTIRENIAFCCEGVTDEAIWAAAEVADVAEAIRQQPEGLDTVLGERGSGLSEGQLQRLAIARAVLSEAPVLLLDECTASLDEATEERVLQRLRALPDRTCLCISHRPAALEICDRVVRVEDGKFVEE